jgi:branched-chain amino acid transport system permease protein
MAMALQTLLRGRHPPSWLKPVAYAALAAALLAAPLLTSNQFLIRVMTMIMIWALLGLGQNVITGFCGQLSFGHAAFYGIGAYTSVLLTIHFGAPYPLALAGAALAAAAFGLVVGYPAVRIGGDYLFLVTIGFAEIARLVFLNWDDVTGGAVGIPNVPPIEFFGWKFLTNIGYYYVALTLLALVVAALSRIVASDIGRCFKAIREDEIAARSVGISLTRYKLMAFAIGAAIGGMAGSVVAHFLAYVGPDMFTNWESTVVFVIVLVGGLGSIPGTIIGAALVVGAFESLRGLVDYRMYVVGALLIGTVLLRPSGLLGAVRLRAPRAPVEPIDEPAESSATPAMEGSAKMLGPQGVSKAKPSAL